MRELIVFVADASMQAVLRAFFERPKFHLRIGCAPFELDASDIVRNPMDTDSGILTRVHERLRKYTPMYARAIVILDAAFETKLSPAEIRHRIEDRLVNNGWEEKQIAVIVLNPELESWLFTGSAHVDEILGFEAGSLRKWLESQGLWKPQAPKPSDPKQAVERALRHQQRKKSTAYYSKIIKKSSVKNCTDPAFLELKATLQTWFPAT